MEAVMPRPPPNTKTTVAKHRVWMGSRTNPVLQCRATPNRRRAKLLAVVAPQADHQGPLQFDRMLETGLRLGISTTPSCPPSSISRSATGRRCFASSPQETRLQLSPSRLTTLLSRRGPSRPRRPSWDQAGKGEKECRDATVAAAPTGWITRRCASPFPTALTIHLQQSSTGTRQKQI